MSTSMLPGPSPSSLVSKNDNTKLKLVITCTSVAESKPLNEILLAFYLM